MVKYRKIPPAVVANQIAGKARIPPAHERKKRNISSDFELMNSFNSFYTSVNEDIPPLDCSVLPAFLPAPGISPLIEPYQVYEKLRSLQPFKSSGPDNIRPHILREFAHEFTYLSQSLINH